MTGRDNRTQINATLLHKALNEGGPQDAQRLMDRLGIDQRAFREAVSYSRRSLDRGLLANEVVCVTNSEPFLYYLAKSKDQSGAYISHRAKIADGHLTSVEHLLKKEMEKFPKHEREIRMALRTVERMREDIVMLLADA